MKNIDEILKFFDEHPYVFAVLYKEKIVFMNKSFKKKIGIKNEKDINVWDLIKDKNAKEEIKNNVKKRINGEVYAIPYENLELNTQTGKRLYVTFYSQTIEIDGNFYGLSIGFDSTQSFVKNKLIEILKNINECIITKNHEEEIFNNTTEIISQFGYQFVITSIIDSNSLEIKYTKGADKEFLSFLKNILKQNNPDCVASEYMVKNEIMIINNIEMIKYKNEKLYNELKKRGTNSLLFIPIFKNNKLFATIGITSEYYIDFPDYVLDIFKEIKKDLEYALEKIEKITTLEILKTAIDNSFAWVVITDEQGNIIYINKEVEKISKYKINELIGKNPKIFKSGYHSEIFYKKMWKRLENNQSVEALIINKDKNGELFYLKDRIVPVVTSNGKKYFMSLAVDVTFEYKLKNRLKYDVLTDLPNRNEFITKSVEFLRKKEKSALLVIDICDFKIYNQIYGNECGDYLLREFAKFLKTFFYEDDLIARIGGDDFAILFEIRNYEDIENVINKLLDKIKNSKIFKNKFAINIGVAIYPKDDKDIIKLLEKSIYALHIAKEKGDFSYEFFNKIYDAKIIEYLDVKNLITDAIENDEFIYQFQPYVDAKTTKIVGAESLLRIQKEDKIIYPNVFIDFLENSNYIKDVEKVMFPKYLKYIQKAKIPISFNISGRSLLDMDHIKKMFADIHELPVVVELTEREIALNINYTKKVFSYLKSKNIKLSIDDFGTGYSSLTYLKELPADFLKIDMSFIKNIEKSKKDLAIVETIIHFAHNLGLKTIAEGVETKEQYELLKNLGCDYLQGYYFYKPMGFDDIMKILS